MKCFVVNTDLGHTYFVAAWTKESARTIMTAALSPQDRPLTVTQRGEFNHDQEGYYVRHYVNYGTTNKGVVHA